MPYRIPTPRPSALSTRPGFARQLLVLLAGVIGLLFLAEPRVSAQILFSEIHYHPVSDDSREEFIELHNTASIPIDLGDWALDRGVSWTFPNQSRLLPGQYLVVAADPARLASLHPDLSPQRIYGPWQGRLSDRGESLRLVDKDGDTIDSVTYADEGAFAERHRTLSRNVRGLRWVARHDGEGPSLELRQRRLPNELGSNWSASQIPHGTPGRANSSDTDNAAPLISNVTHAPPIPRSNQSVRITFDLHDEIPDTLNARLLYSDNDAPFQEAPVVLGSSDGESQRRATAILPPQPDKTIIAFYIEASDDTGASATWPRPTLPESLQEANAHYQVIDRSPAEAYPEFHIIMTPSESQRFRDAVKPWNFNEAGERSRNFKIYADSRFNATVVSTFDGQQRVRYQVDIRNRGNGSRERTPNNFRIDFPSDRRWRGVEKLNLNAQFPWIQTMGAALSQQVGLIAAPSRLAEVFLNGMPNAPESFASYGRYAANDVINSDYAQNQGLGRANIYRGIRASGVEEADFQYLGEETTLYRRVYFKETNQTEDDWSDLIALTRTLSEVPDEEFETQVRQWIDVNQWTRFLAAETFYVNQESALGNGVGDDYAMYRSVEDGRFRLIPYDQDTILGQGDTPASPTAGLWLATRGTAIRRFLTWPNFAPLYYSNLVQVAEGPLSADSLRSLLPRILEHSQVPESRLAQTISFAETRARFILDSIPRSLSLDLALPRQANTFEAPSGMRSLPLITGSSDATQTARVTLNGTDTQWDPVSATWSHTEIPLAAGRNRFILQSWNPQGEAIEELVFTVNVPSSPPETRLNQPTLTTDTHWTQEQSPIQIDAPLLIPSGVALTVDAGVQLQFAPGVRLRAHGKLELVGSRTHPVVLTSATTNPWSGLSLEAGSETLLTHTHFENIRPPAEEGALSVHHASLNAHDCVWDAIQGRIIRCEESTLALESCRFTTDASESMITITATSPGADTQITRSTLIHPNASAPSILLSYGSPDLAPPLFKENRFEIGSGPAIQTENAAPIVAGNFFASNSSEQISAGIRLVKTTPTAHHTDVVLNEFRQITNPIQTDGDITLAAHNNLFETASSAIRVTKGQLNGEWVNNLHHQLSSGILVTQDPDTSANLILDHNISDEPLADTSTAVIPASEWRVERALDETRILPGSPFLATGRANVNIGPDSPPLPDLFPATSLSWPETGGMIPLWAPGIDRIEITPVGSDTVTTIQNGANWSPAASEAGLLPFTIQFFDRRNELMGSQEAVFDFQPNAPRVQISEIAANLAGSGDWIELANRADTALDLTGYGLTDDPSFLNRFTFAPGTTLSPNGFIVIHSGTDFPFQLNGNGETVLLSSPTGQIVDQIEFGPQLPDATLARFDIDTWRLAHPTPEGLNRARFTGDPARVQIAEYLTQPGPADEHREFLELVNTSALPVSLGDLFFSNLPETEPRRGQFPAYSFLAAGARFTLTEDASTLASSRRLPFALPSSPGVLSLQTTDGRNSDRVWHGPQREGISEARNANGGIDRLSQPTPGFGPSSEGPSTTLVRQELVSQSQVWRYEDSGNDQGDTWRTTGFQDTEWPSGPGILAAGEPNLPGQLGTTLSPNRITTYFRTTFQYDGLLPPHTAQFDLLVDDGAVIYLNGHEISRVRLPEDRAISYLTHASHVIDADWITAIPVDTTLIQPGENLLAVEVHQSSPTSSDVVFGFSLEAEVTGGGANTVRISEVLADNRSFPIDPDLAPGDWVELENPSPFPVSLEPLYLTDRLTRNAAWQFPPGAVLAGGERVVVHFAPSSEAPGFNTGFGLNAAGDAVFLLQNVDDRLEIVDQVQFGLQVADVSLNRQDNTFIPGRPSPNQPNQLLALGNIEQIRINEWMARVSDGPDWLELYNPSAGVVDLSGASISDHPFSPDRHRFPPHSYLGSGDHAWRQLFASGNPEDGTDQLDFRLGGNGDGIALFTPTGSLVDSIEFGPQGVDQSEGRSPDGGDTIGIQVVASPGQSNANDRDQDGIDDAWEQLFGLNPADPADAIQDRDQDGLSNRDEFLLGTDPTSAASGLAIHAWEFDGDTFTISFTTIPGRRYEVQETGILSPSEWQTIWISTESSGPTSVSLPTAPDHAFIRVLSF